MNELTVGTIIVPYMSGEPIMLLDNYQEGSTDTFIRAQKHEETGIWYADVDPNAVNGVALPSNPQGSRLIGAVVFLIAKQIRTGQGVRITRVFKGGTSARGVLIKLPPETSYPYSFDTKSLFKPLPKEQTT